MRAIHVHTLPFLPSAPDTAAPSTEGTDVLADFAESALRRPVPPDPSVQETCRLAEIVRKRIAVQAEIWRQITLEFAVTAFLWPGNQVCCGLAIHQRLWLLGTNPANWVLLCLESFELLDAAPLREAVQKGRRLPVALKDFPRSAAPAADIAALEACSDLLDASLVVERLRCDAASLMATSQRDLRLRMHAWHPDA